MTLVLTQAVGKPAPALALQLQLSISKITITRNVDENTLHRRAGLVTVSEDQIRW